MKKDKFSPEMHGAVLRTLYHHPRSTPVIVSMITGLRFETPPPLPTESEKQMAHETVERLIALYYEIFREACIEVTGEDPAIDWH